MSKSRNRGADAFSGVNPQGYSVGADTAKDPKGKLENAAKKDNTK
ncbi:small, acid-soluble spore protein L [Peribacillus cavernae]|uniref:Small, acid-soluble spore protein L n=1 Tax=Peribacillus cavernae TaxID=1674310 RepID=A0A3S0UD90_9BACI|nr:small, acid-soluble spore protein L [Peribacillus cavernae]MDQ0218014.1 small acid-soluble spore protein L (minor) [Peribacillus cavernae]RUQ28941.1 small, acid-soluble spore protein L [Peribacillus cavernae]